MKTTRVSPDLDHALRRMAQHACRLLIDAHVIAEHQKNREQGERGKYILWLIALEILMKAGALCHERELRDFRHDFPALFDDQLREVQSWVESEFGARSLGKAFQTGRTLDSQLAALTGNYTTARYVYETDIQYTEAGRLKREEAFLRGELPEPEWDIIYHAELVRLLTEAMLGYLARWLPPWFDPSEVELFPPTAGTLTPGH